MQANRTKPGKASSGGTKARRAHDGRMGAAALTPRALLRELRRTLADRGVDADAVLHRRGQLEAVRARARGRAFPREAYVRAMILAWLSARRPWTRIGEELEALARVFRDYDPRKLRRADPGALAERVLTLRCGNRGIHLQLAALPENLRRLQALEREWGSLDAFVTSDEPEAIARAWSRPGGAEKLEQVGPSVAREMLRFVGVEAAKPASLVRRMIGPERLGLVEDAGPRAAAAAVERLAAAAKREVTEVDTLLWMYCAPDQADVCGSDPRCDACRLAKHCRVGAA